MLISVIIPTLNDEACLPVTLRPLAGHRDVELIVVDGGSTDRTVAIAQRFTPYVFVTTAHRAEQMNFGGRHATGGILLFLHADSFLMPGALEEIQRRMMGGGAVAGAFDLNVDSHRRFSRFVARISSGRARALKLPRGEQGIFVWRQVFDVLGGFPEIPIMEDIAFACRLRRAGRVMFIRSGLISTAQHWTAHGVLRAALVDWWLTMLYLLRVPPRHLRRIQDGWFWDGKTSRTQSDQVARRLKSLQERS